VLINPELLERSPLRPREKEVLRKVHIEGRKITEIAREKGLTKGAVSIRHKKALQRYNSWIKANRAVKIVVELLNRGYTLDDAERTISLAKRIENIEAEIKMIKNTLGSLLKEAKKEIRIGHIVVEE